jgi:hypothetical protein
MGVGMRHGLLAGASALAMLLGAAGAAQATTFKYENVVQTYTVPTTGLYDLTVEGAQGGSASHNRSIGGLGAEVSGEVSLSAGEVLQIVVGGVGTGGFDGAGGGGGSFVYLSDKTHPIAVAGGGGGAGESHNGDAGSTNANGGQGGGSDGGAGGLNGSGGGYAPAASGYAGSAGGAGWKSNGKGSSKGSYATQGGYGPTSFKGHPFQGVWLIASFGG